MEFDLVILFDYPKGEPSQIDPMMKKTESVFYVNSTLR